MRLAQGDPPPKLIAEILDATALPEDIEGIIAACQDYFEGWYTADATQMQDCLHPGLAKRSVARDQDQQRWVLRHLDAPAMIRATREGRGTLRARERDRWMHVTIRDVYRRIASATVVSYPYVEYVHLAKFDDRWRVVKHTLGVAGRLSAA